MDNRVTNVFSDANQGRIALRCRPNSAIGMRAGSSRLVWLFIAFAVPLVAVAARLVQLQCFLADDYVAAFETTTESLEAIPSIDGRIYASDGRVLAEDVERFNISVHYRWLEDPPNEHWLTRQALSGLSRAERRNRVIVEAQKQKILARRDALWARLSELSGLSPKSLVRRNGPRSSSASSGLQPDSPNVRRLAKTKFPLSLPFGTPAARGCNGFGSFSTAALTTPPRREADEPIIARETLDYHPIIQRRASGGSGRDRGASPLVSRRACRVPLPTGLL